MLMSVMHISYFYHSLMSMTSEFLEYVCPALYFILKYITTYILISIGYVSIILYNISLELNYSR